MNGVAREELATEMQQQQQQQHNHSSIKIE